MINEAFQSKINEDEFLFLVFLKLAELDSGFQGLT